MKTSEELFALERMEIARRHSQGITEKEDDIIHLLKQYVANEINRLEQKLTEEINKKCQAN